MTPEETKTKAPPTKEEINDPNLSLEEQVRKALTRVVDPEMGFNIVELGLVYAVDASKPDDVKVSMTLTSPMCPVGPQIIGSAKSAIQSVDGVEAGTVDLVWTPPWDPKKHATDEIKDMLGIW